MHNVTVTTPVKLHGFKDKEKDSTKKLQGVCKALVRKWYTYFPWHMLFTLHKCLSSFHPFTHFLYLTNCCQFFTPSENIFWVTYMGWSSLWRIIPLYMTHHTILFSSLYFFYHTKWTLGSLYLRASFKFASLYLQCPGWGQMIWTTVP